MKEQPTPLSEKKTVTDDKNFKNVGQTARFADRPNNTDPRLNFFSHRLKVF